MTKPSSQWTVDTLKEHLESLLTSWRSYVDQRFNDNDKAVHAALQAAERAATNLASELKQYKAESNEWRGAMNDKDKLLTRTTETERIEADVKKLQLWEAKLSGMATQADVNRAQLIAVVSAIGALVSIGIAIASIYFK